MSKIFNISTALPEHRHAQQDIAEFMAKVYEEEFGEDIGRKLKLLYERSSIRSRYSVIPEYTIINDRDFIPAKAGENEWPDVSKRLKIFDSHAGKLASQALLKSASILNNVKEITHLITVSCTGMSAPGLDIDIIRILNLDTNINRTSVNFMGCYAAIHALKQADYICRSNPDAIVAVVCVELCTLHFQNAADKDNQTANMIFGDGCAACLVMGETTAAKYSGNQSAEIAGFYSDLVFTGINDMAWNITARGFEMVLSSYIPDLIKQDIQQLLDKALDRFGMQRDEIHNWAIHPGGKKILEAVGQALSLTDDQLKESYQVLSEYGNMSSATILFVIKEILENKSKSAHPTFAVAFGPGLTLESMLLKNV